MSVGPSAYHNGEAKGKEHRQRNRNMSGRYSGPLFDGFPDSHPMKPTHIMGFFNPTW